MAEMNQLEWRKLNSSLLPTITGQLPQFQPQTCSSCKKELLPPEEAGRCGWFSDCIRSWDKAHSQYLATSKTMLSTGVRSGNVLRKNMISSDVLQNYHSSPLLRHQASHMWHMRSVTHTHNSIQATQAPRTIWAQIHRLTLLFQQHLSSLINPIFGWFYKNIAYFFIAQVEYAGLEADTVVIV